MIININHEIEISDLAEIFSCLSKRDIEFFIISICEKLNDDDFTIDMIKELLELMQVNVKSINNIENIIIQNREEFLGE